MYSQPSPEPRPNFQAGGKTVKQLYIQSFSTQRINSYTRVKLSPCGKYTFLYGLNQPASLFLREGATLLPLFHSQLPIKEVDFAYSRLKGTREIAIVQAAGMGMRLMTSYVPQANGGFAMHLLPLPIPLAGIDLIAYSASSEKLFLSTRAGKTTMLDCLKDTAERFIQPPETAPSIMAGRAQEITPALQKLIPNSFNDNQVIALTRDGKLRLEEMMSGSTQPLRLALPHETAPINWLQYHQHLPVLAVHDCSGAINILKLDEPSLEPLKLQTPAGPFQNLDFVRDDDQINLTAVTTTSAFNLKTTTNEGEEDKVGLKLEDSYELISINEINQLWYASGARACRILSARDTGKELIVAVAVL